MEKWKTASRSRGRPKTSLLAMLRTRVWFKSVARAVGGKKPATYYKVAQAFGDGTGREDPSLWLKYSKEETVPSASTLKVAERLYPGTRTAFDDGPEGVRLWDALDPGTAAAQRVASIEAMSCEWEKLKDPPTAVKRWLEFWPPVQANLDELFDDALEICPALAEVDPLQAAAISAHLWHATAGGFWGALAIGELSPARNLFNLTILAAGEKLKEHGITLGDVEMVASLMSQPETGELLRRVSDKQLKKIQASRDRNQKARERVARKQEHFRFNGMKRSRSRK